MPIEYILVVAIILTAPYDVQVQVADIDGGMGMYRGGVITIDKDIPRFELVDTIYHEINHHRWALMTWRQRERIRKRLSVRPNVYFDSVEEEWCELEALSQQRY